ncbi:MAG: GNAT family N-acetyltransferase [Lysobacterales bacterium]
MISLPRPRPERRVLEGRFTRLEPLGPAHSEHLYAASAGAENRSRFDYLFEDPPGRLADIEAWISRVGESGDPLYFAVIDRASGRCEGRQALMRITPEHGVIEVGSIYWGPAIARTRVATEALYLHLQYAFDTLGYRRFEWKCNDQNEPSKRAARRFGFVWEGLFRQHMVTKGGNRDTAWFSIIDRDWPAIRAAFEGWLTPGNFDAAGCQREPLRTWVGR